MAIPKPVSPVTSPASNAANIATIKAASSKAALSRVVADG
jgi:hypothetical protein